MRIYLIGFIILALLGSAGYVIKLQRDNTILKENAVKLEGAISEQKQVIENQKKDFAEILEANKKINDLVNPSFQDEEPVNPFDLLEGANFKMKIRNVEGYRNYDKSEFDSAGPLFEDESMYDDVLESLRPLAPVIAPSEFKSYDELKARLHRVMGWDQNQFEEAPARTERATEMTEMSKAETFDSGSSDSSDDEEGLDFFKKLAEA